MYLQSNQEEEDLHESDYDDDEMDTGGGGGIASLNGNGNSSAALLSRIKMEQLAGGDTEALLGMSRYADKSDLQKELAQNERLQREVVAAMHRQIAAQTAFQAASALPSATPWTPAMQTATSPLPLSINSSVTSSSAATAPTSSLISSSSPGGASGSSGPTSSSTNLQHVEAGKGYTFEEQFKQVR